MPVIFRQLQILLIMDSLSSGEYLPLFQNSASR